VRQLPVIASCAAALVLLGCTSSGKTPTPTPTTSTRVISSTTTRTVTPGRKFHPPRATSVAPFPASGKAPKGEVLRSCPYIKAGLDSEPTSGPNIADLEGDRVGRITVLTRYHPVGCRFYFLYAYGNTQHEAVADILPYTFASHTAAYNAMILTARAGRNAQPVPGFVKGLTGIQYQTRFFGPDGDRDWAFVFVKRKIMVVVHTQQNNAQLNAQNIAAAIAKKF
jgi:hypothetical protein